jgi:hypothetical protein
MSLSGDQGRVRFFESVLRALFTFVFSRNLPFGEILRGSFGNMAIRMRLRVMNPLSCHTLKYTCHIIKLLVE